ncbi:MAG TPA: glycosyltransferase, partial [Paenirhodobacter sp.]
PFEAYYTGLFPATGWPRSLREVLGDLPPVVLTSRLDNDDALCVDYMERTAAAARGLSGGLAPASRAGIVITEGFIRSEIGAYAISHPCNAFTSWLERTEREDVLLTAMGINHMDAAQFGPLTQVPGPGGWLQVVHGGNVSNRIRGRRISPAALKGRLPEGALTGLTPIGPAGLLLENSLLTPLRAGRDRVVIIAKKILGRGNRPR